LPEITAMRTIQLDQKEVSETAVGNMKKKTVRKFGVERVLQHDITPATRTISP